jgi:hypothetical protein
VESGLRRAFSDCRASPCPDSFLVWRRRRRKLVDRRISTAASTTSTTCNRFVHPAGGFSLADGSRGPNHDPGKLKALFQSEVSPFFPTLLSECHWRSGRSTFGLVMRSQLRKSLLNFCGHRAVTDSMHGVCSGNRTSRYRSNFGPIQE